MGLLSGKVMQTSSELEIKRAYDIYLWLELWIWRNQLIRIPYLSGWNGSECCMTVCHHRNIELLPGGKDRLRCRHCHLAISSDAIGDGYCPECYKNNARKWYDFDAVTPAKIWKSGYRYEDCGAIIECKQAVTYRVEKKEVTPESQRWLYAKHQLPDFSLKYSGNTVNRTAARSPSFIW